MSYQDNISHICVRGAREHNLQNVNVDVPRNKLVVITGVSGSGKSSLAFDTIYAEGQRRYVESLSAYARQFLELQDKPEVESITGLSPAIAIDQKTISKNPRSTVCTATEVYDYLRLLYARVGIPYSPITGQPISKQTSSQMIDEIKKLPVGTKLYILAPIVRGHKGEHRKEILELKKQGFERVKLDDVVYKIVDLPALDKNKRHTIEVVVDRIVICEDLGNRLADSVEMALNMGDGILSVEVVELPDDYTGKDYQNGQVILFSEKFACPVSGFTLTEIEPRIFSFNSPYGACPKCSGLGYEHYFDPILIIPNPELSLKEGAIAPWHNDSGKQKGSELKFQYQTLESLANHYNFSPNVPFKDLSPEIQDLILYGSKGEEIRFIYNDGFRRQTIHQPFEGVVPLLEKRLDKTESDFVREELRYYQNRRSCTECGGHRLKKESLSVKIGGKHIGEVCAMTVGEAQIWFNNLTASLSAKHQQIAERALKEVQRRIGFLNDVGLEYLTLNRESGSLSGGEGQRIRLASQIGSGLSGVLYVLDEPSIGLHQCDNDRLLATLKKLRDLGNSVLVVEHDEDTMVAADYLIDVGPGAGVHGGNIVAFGTPQEVAANHNSITGNYLSGRDGILVPSSRRYSEDGRFIEVIGARANNLKNIDVALPLGCFIAITGVSGSGKSSFTIQTLYKAVMRHLHSSKLIPGEHDRITGLEYIDKIIEIDQSPIGRTPRSNPATYTGAFTPIREWFAGLPESKMRGYKAGRFSFNVRGGRCEACEGDGVIKIEMHFLPDVYVKCEECQGARYNRETLEVKYKGKSIADVLEMTIEEASEFFENVPMVHEKMVALMEVGLGYMKVGQPATTISGGEAQRVKLAKELSRRSTGRTLHILDEPTTGLHSQDIKGLLSVLHKLVDANNTVVVIEHNLDVIKTADYIIDIGPHGGDNGGKLVACGTPEQVAANPDSITGQYLKKYLHKSIL